MRQGIDTFEILWCKQSRVQKVRKAGPMAKIKSKQQKCVNVQSNERKPIIEKCQCSVHTHKEPKKKEGGEGADSLGIIGSGGEGWGTGRVKGGGYSN